jgi:hypothetical protein
MTEEFESAKVNYWVNQRKMPGHLESLYYNGGSAAYEKWRSLYEHTVVNATDRAEFSKAPWIERRERGEKDYQP